MKVPANRISGGIGKRSTLVRGIGSDRDGRSHVKIEGYDSKKEYRRAKELKLLEKKGIITGLQEQVKYELISPQYRFYEVQGVRKMLRKKELLERGVYYIADFVYYRDGEYVVEDTKGVRTKEYIIKRKLMLYVHGIRIKEV